MRGTVFYLCSTIQATTSGMFGIMALLTYILCEPARQRYAAFLRTILRNNDGTHNEQRETSGAGADDNCNAT